MDQRELRLKIDRVMDQIRAELPTAGPDDVKTAKLIMAGIEVFGELLIDIKRIADAAEIEIHPEFNAFGNHTPETKAIDGTPPAPRKK